MGRNSRARRTKRLRNIIWQKYHQKYPDLQPETLEETIQELLRSRKRFTVDYAVPIGDIDPEYEQNIDKDSFPKYASVEEFFEASEGIDKWLLDIWFGLIANDFVPSSAPVPKTPTSSILSLFKSALHENLYYFSYTIANTTIYHRPSIYPFIREWLREFTSEYWAEMFDLLVSHTIKNRSSNEFKLYWDNGAPYPFPCWGYICKRVLEFEIEQKTSQTRQHKSHTSPKPHTRRGHWRRVAVGTGKKERIWRWIEETHVNKATLKTTSS